MPLPAFFSIPTVGNATLHRLLVLEYWLPIGKQQAAQSKEQASRCAAKTTRQERPQTSLMAHGCCLAAGGSGRLFSSLAWRRSHFSVSVSRCWDSSPSVYIQCSDVRKRKIKQARSDVLRVCRTISLSRERKGVVHSTHPVYSSVV